LSYAIYGSVEEVGDDDDLSTQPIHSSGKSVF
jgi:hypothetical protein